MSKFLVMYLDGPLQGWGYMADHKYRNTLPHPTRSGITGILCAALGIDRNDPEEPEKVNRINGLRMTVLGIQTVSGRGGRQIRDYHTAQTLNSLRKPVGNAEVTYRNYLIDTRFLVLLEGDGTLLNQMEQGLRDPVWFGSLGRRSCVPASPLFLGRFESEAEAVESIQKRLGDSVHVTLRVDEGSGLGATLLRDLPLGFGTRTHGQRMVRVTVL